VPSAAADLAAFLALGGTASDICGEVTISHVGDVSDGQECPETITRTYRATDECGLTADCDQLFTVECCADSFCTLTQGAYGSEGGNNFGMTTIDLIESLLSTDLVVGILGVRSVTFGFEDAQCIIDRLPGGTTATTLPEGLGDVEMNNATCQTSPELPLKNGRFRNVFLAQVITLSLNTRYDLNLSGFDLCPYIVANGSGSIPADVLTALSNLGLPDDVGGLLELANRALAGLPTGGATVTQINDAVDAINNVFDECATLIFCGEAPPPVNLGISAASAAKAVPFDFALEQNYPNPFNASTRIGFTLAEDAMVDLAVYNVLGQRVATLMEGLQSAGQHEVVWNGATDHGRTVATGVYFYRLAVAGSIHTRKMFLLK
jgi:hypothetical protein